jgi:hypothetical protein
MTSAHLTTFIAGCAIATGTLSALAVDAAPIAGLTPERRPAGAPTIAIAPAYDGADSPFLHGVTEPIPASLKFLLDQGNWYSPFGHPGMTGRYDIRGWHAKPSTRK